MDFKGFIIFSQFIFPLIGIYSYLNDDKSQQHKNLIITEDKFKELNLNKFVPVKGDLNKKYEAVKHIACYDVD